MAWLTGYTYRVPITVTNSTGGTLTNYQVHITLNTSSLITAGKLQSSGNDLTATDSNGSTQLSSWFDPTTLNTTTTDLWIKIPSLPAGTYTVYVYYGNSGASMQSSIVNTFIYGDDFSSNTIANYTTAGTTVTVDTTNKWMKFAGVNGAGNTVATPTTQTDPASYIVEAKVSLDALNTDDIGGLLGFKSTLTGGDGYVTQIGAVSGTNSVDIEKFTVAHLINTPVTLNINTFYPVKGIFVSGNITATFNNTTSVNSTDTSYTSGYYGMRSYNPVIAANVYFRYFRVRQYTATEPTTSNGSEQTQVIGVHGTLSMMGIGN